MNRKVITETRYHQVIERIKTIKNEFAESPALFLTEDDLKCYMYHKLYDLFDHSMETFNPPIKGSPLHSEVKFFDEDAKLLLKPDLSIIEPSNLSLLHSISDTVIAKNGLRYKSTSSKNFEFGYNCIAIEIKFYRNKNGITKKNIDAIKYDLLKLKRLATIANSYDEHYKVYSIMVVFNKTNKSHHLFQELISQYLDKKEVAIIYGSSNLEMN